MGLGMIRRMIEKVKVLDLLRIAGLVFGGVLVGLNFGGVDAILFGMMEFECVPREKNFGGAAWIQRAGQE